MQSNFSRTLLLGILLTLCLPAATQAQYAYDIVSLGNVVPKGLNNQGQVVGYYFTGFQQIHAFVYRNGQTTDLFPANSNVSTVAYGINDRGQIAGVGPNGPAISDLRTGMTQDLGLTTNSFAYAINQNGDVGGAYRYQSPFGPTRAYIYSSSTGQFHDITQTTGMAGITEVDAINNVGQAAGKLGVIGSGVHAFLYSNGVAQDIGTVPGATDAEVTSMNDSGVVVGYGLVTNAGVHAFVYRNGQMQDLGAQISSGSMSSANGINNAGDIVGSYGQGGFLYHNGVAQSLNSLIDPSLGWNIGGATSINDNGQITGTGNFGAFLLTPHVSAVPAPGSLLTFGVGGGVLLLAARRRRLRSF